MPIGRALFVSTAAILICAATAGAQNWVAAVFPERSHDFGTVARGSKLRHAFRIVNTTDSEVHIADWHTKCGCTDVKVRSRDIPPGTQTTVEATLDTSQFQGYKPSGLTLILDRPQSAQIDLNMTCFIRGDLLLNPGQVDFGVVARKSKPTVSLTLTYMGGQSNWAVTKMNTISSLVSAQLRELEHPPGSPTQYQLIATLDSAAPSGYFKDEIALVTNDPSSPRIPISVVGTVQAAVSVSPSILNLGRLRPGQTVTQRVLVRSAQPFRLTELKSAKGDLTATPPSDEARTLQVVTVSLKAPTQTGPYNDVLEIATDLKDEPPAKVTAFATITP
jgi:hypothetical protein